jgi:hypothetical protein
MMLSSKALRLQYAGQLLSPTTTLNKYQAMTTLLCIACNFFEKELGLVSSLLEMDKAPIQRNGPPV